ncbi:urea ABC transporter ATP-binding subunit UrtE [Alkalilimnicola ehrlichii MLHE-1]|uniref:Amino acid/amide ABC transporter ATP-binding protein 2, HAAT family n=1 Tax=Alkalilimnicola ehrlichii (strain ATCC BAA-1101 / DSM 17681 / MLHE-1) TaxID=187272 RepID=Q0AC90_ALKEH|nr:urea ABC transporter ATP-binding subunit UrtE [Alkalilimnicola ehrlichii]ABI55547.1 amino acid/amide ABC transporter ATP-binding protein 2, HAAT family [Alkalilimnicola ehrlichii MLHE-1]
MLEIKGLNQYYGGSHILKGVDLAVEQGTCACLMGRNGMGKTTLLKCLMGLVPIADGSITFQGREISRLRPQQRARMGIGYVPQGREIFPQLTVEENLRVPLAGKRSRGIPERIFELFPVLKEMARRRGGDLSGGQQQQLAIGRALVLQPEILLLDEPNEGIQPNIVRQIGEVIRMLNREEGLTILLVEQKLPFARATGDHFTLLNNGRAVASGAMSQLSDELIQEHMTV